MSDEVPQIARQSGAAIINFDIDYVKRRYSSGLVADSLQKMMEAVSALNLFAAFAIITGYKPAV